MAGILTTVYSVVILLVALAGTAFVFALPGGPGVESSWSRWGNFAAVAIFLIALVLALVVGT